MSSGTVPKKSRPQPKGGSRKGIPNKVTTELRTMILNALDSAGGEAYLVTQAKKNPRAFLALLGKVLPMQVTGASNGPLQVQLSAGEFREIAQELLSQI